MIDFGPQTILERPVGHEEKLEGSVWRSSARLTAPQLQNGPEIFLNKISEKNKSFSNFCLEIFRAHFGAAELSVWRSFAKPAPLTFPHGRRAATTPSGGSKSTIYSRTNLKIPDTVTIKNLYLRGPGAGLVRARFGHSFQVVVQLGQYTS